MKHLLRLLPYLKKYRSGVIAGLFFVVTANMLAAFLPWLLGRIVDVIGWSIGMDYVTPLIGFFLLLVLIEGVLRYYMRKVLIGISRWIEYDLRNDLFTHVQTFSLSIFARIRTGTIMSRATNDIGNVRMALGPGIMYTFETLVTLVFALAIMINISPFLTLMTMLPMPLLTGLILFTSKVLHQRYSTIQKSLAELTTVVQENVSGIRVVKGHCRESGEIHSFLKESDKLRESNLSAARFFSGFIPLMMAFAGLITVIILYYGGVMVIQKEISLGDLVAFFAYLGLLIWPMTSIGWVINIFQRGAASMKLINELMAESSEISDALDAEELQKISGAIRFNGISFSYGADEPAVLHDIELEIKPGQTVAVVGPTGAGKSTLLKLIPRLYDSQLGSVTVDGRDVRRIKLDSLRSAIGYVPQETFLFSETVAENIAFGAHGEQIDRAGIERAAEISKLNKDIESFKKGYDTILGERGVNMSGGQKQRTAISRALVGNPKILLLDDCLSAVDTNTEREILEGLRKELRDRTAIIVSHRMSSIMDADQIVVLQEGRITERGTHVELLNLKGRYADLWYKQQLSEELEVK